LWSVFLVSVAARCKIRYLIQLVAKKTSSLKTKSRKKRIAKKRTRGKRRCANSFSIGGALTAKEFKQAVRAFPNADNTKKTAFRGLKFRVVCDQGGKEQSKLRGIVGR